MPHLDEDPQQFLDWLQPELEQGPREQSDSLRKISTHLKELRDNGNVGAQERILELLGTALGRHRSWQTPVRESGLLESVLTGLDVSTTPKGLAKQYLRVIGNSVADNDVNREVVTGAFGTIVTFLEREELIMTALAVMLNLCNDYDPAQNEAAKLRLDSTIAEFLVSDKVPEEAIDFATDLLTWTTEKLSPIQLKDSLSVKTFNNVLRVALHYDEEHCHDYVAVLAHYLQDPEFQQQLATLDTLDRLVDLMLDYETHLTPEESQAVLQELSTHKNPETTESEETSVLLIVQLVNSLSSISATDAFIRDLDLRSPVVEKITSRLHSPETVPSTVCACVVLGNLATSDQVCIDMVREMGLHLTLIDILSSRSESALLYAAAGFMRHLAFPEANRSVLGEAGLIEACCHLLLNKDPSVRGETAAILAKLVSNIFPNIEKVVYEFLPKGITPTQLPSVEVPTNPTVLYHLVTQALVPSAPLPSTSMKNAMVEIGRTIIAILRYLGQTHSAEDVEPIARHMYKTPLVARPIAQLVRQRFYADARSEGLLGLGLMAQSHEGASCVIGEIAADSGLLDAIKEFAIDQKKEGQSGVAARRDYQNALVLLHGLAMNGVNAMDSSTKSELENLQAELSRLMT